MKKVSKEEEEWIGEEIQLTRKQIKQHEEREQREENIWAIERTRNPITPTTCELAFVEDWSGEGPGGGN